MKKKLFNIELSEEAIEDFDNSYNFYYEDSFKVADTFFKQINISFEIIKQNPTSFPVVYKDVRKFVVKKFPFLVYYRITNSVIQVIAIFHSSRNPEIWNERI